MPLIKEDLRVANGVTMDKAIQSMTSIRFTSDNPSSWPDQRLRTYELTHCVVYFDVADAFSVARASPHTAR